MWQHWQIPLTWFCTVMVSRCLCNSTILVSNNMAVIFLESVTRTLLLRFGVLTKPSNRPKLKAFFCCLASPPMASAWWLLMYGCCAADFTMTGVNVWPVAAIRLAMPLLRCWPTVTSGDDALRCTNGTRMRGFAGSNDVLQMQRQNQKVG